MTIFLRRIFLYNPIKKTASTRSSITPINYFALIFPIDPDSRHKYYNWKSLGYQAPAGCDMFQYKNEPGNICGDDFITPFIKYNDGKDMPEERELWCQVCSENGTWNMGDWLFTSK